MFPYQGKQPVDFIAAHYIPEGYHTATPYMVIKDAAKAPQLAAVAPKDIKPLAQLFCPVYTDRRVHPKSLALVQNGRTIYFSRERARERFQENPDKFLQQLK